MATINISPTGTNDGTAINTAISGANSGDIILLSGGNYDINTTILMAAGITLKGEDEDNVILVANGLTTNSVVYSNAVNNTTVTTLTVNGNSEADTGGVQFRNSNNHSISNVTVRNTGGHQVMFYGCDSCSASNITTSSVTGLTGTSHGFDIDQHVATPTTNLTITNSTFENGEGTRDSFKAENCTSVTVTSCTLTGRVILSDTAPTDCGVTFDTCTMNGVVSVNQTDATEEPTIQNSTFTRDGGAVLETNGTGCNLHISGCTFLGRNKVVAYYTSNWQTLSGTITEANNTHPGASDDGGKTVFASENSVGKLYNTTPYITPDIARNDIEVMIEDTAFDDANIHYAVVSGVGTHNDARTSIAPQAIVQTIEGYPNQAVISVEVSNADFIVLTNASADVNLKNLKIIGMEGGAQALRQTNGSLKAVDCEFSDTTGGHLTVSAIEYRAANLSTAYAKYTNCTFHDIQNTADGAAVVCRADATPTSAEMIFEGCKFYSNTTTGGGMIRHTPTNNPILTIRGCEFYSNTGNAVGGIFISAASTTTTIESCTFSGNTGTNEDVYGATNYTVTNCIVEDSTTLGGTGIVTMSYCLSSDGAGANTDDNTITGTPTYVDSANNDYNLTSDSLGVGTGKASATRTFVGANSEPVANFETDIGGNQSTHNASHPTNL